MTESSSDIAPPEINDDGYGTRRHVLVTGASGFVGMWLCQRLREQGYQVIALSQRDGDVSQKNFFDKYSDFDVSHVFHLAARTFVPDSWEDPDGFYTTNVTGTLNALEFCRTKKISITYVSAYIYGAQEVQPISENARIQPSNPYAHSKYLSEQLCEFYSATFAIQCTVVRPFNIYGHGQNEKFLIPSIINQTLHSHEIYVKDLAPRRDYLYIKDFIDILVQTMKGKSRFAIYNAGSGHSLSVSSVIEIIQRVCAQDKKVISEHSARRGELADTIADVTKLKVDYGWEPKYTFEAGIKDMVTECGEPNVRFH